MKNKKSPCMLPLASRNSLTKEKKSAKKPSEYKIKLIERMKFKYNFLINERQMKHNLKNSRQLTVRHLLNRLDLVLYSTLASNKKFLTLSEIRQKIRHGKILVNNVRERRPNYECQPSDVIYIKETKKSSKSRHRSMNQAYSLDFSNLKT